MADKEFTEVTVKEASHEDAGRSIARVSIDVMKKLGLVSGDVIEIQGKKKAAAVVWPGFQDSGSNIISIDGNIRGNLSTGIDEKVRIRKSEAEYAKKVVIQPMQPIRLVGGEQYLSRLLRGRAVYEGQTQRIDVMGNSITLVIAKVQPKGIAIVTDDTEIELKVEPYNPEEGKKELSDIHYEDIGGLGRELQLVRELIELPMKHPEIFEILGIKPPKGVLFYGTPGSGKTLIAKAVANEVDAHFITLSGPEIMSKFYGDSEKALRDKFHDAEEHSPSIIFIDEIDSIAPKREEVHGEVERRVVAQLLTLMDGLTGRGQVIVIAATNLLNSIDPALRRGGRFDREIEIGIPDKKGRLEIFQVHTRGVPLDNDINLEDLAETTFGFVGADIAGLDEIKHTLIKIIEGRITFPQIFEKLNYTPPKGILLFGPPGTGKTLLVKGIASKRHINFISIKGPELLSKGVGDSEKHVREAFKKARQSAPCILFFDEIDSMFPKRGTISDSTHVTESVMSQFLTELDGIEELKDVFVIGATNRPDLLDPALLRPGRLEKHLFVPPPDEEARIAILGIYLKDIQEILDSDVNIIDLAKKTPFFVGADLESLVREVKAGVIDELTLNDNQDLDTIKISKKHFYSVLEKMKGSLDSADFEKYEQKSWDLLFTQAKREVLYNAVHLLEQIDILKRRQGADAGIIHRYEDLKDQVYWREKSFEMIQKSSDELRELVFFQLKKTPPQ